MKPPTKDEIRAARAAAGLTLAAAAELAGLGAGGRWAEYESGRRCIDPMRWQMFLLLIDRHPAYRLVKRRHSPGRH